MEHHTRTKENMNHYINAIQERNKVLGEQEKRIKELSEIESGPQSKPKTFKNRKGKKRKGPTQKKNKTLNLK